MTPFQLPLKFPLTERIKFFGEFLIEKVGKIPNKICEYYQRQRIATVTYDRSLIPYNN